MKTVFCILFCTLGSIKCYPQTPEKSIIIMNIEHLDRAEIAQEISIVNSLNPKVIALDVKFDVSHHDEKDTKLAHAIRACKNLVMTTVVHNLNGKIFISLASQGEFSSSRLRTGFINTVLERDEKATLRRFTAWEEESYVNSATGVRRIEYHFGVRTAMVFDSLKAMTFVKSHAKIVDIDYNDEKRKFKKYSAKEVLDGKLTKKDIENKIIMLGFLGPGNEDKFFTPLNKDHKNPDMYGVEYLAHIVAQVLEDRK